MRDSYDFSNGTRGAVVKTTKERITIRLAPDIIQRIPAHEDIRTKAATLVRFIHSPGGDVLISAGQK